MGKGEAKKKNNATRQAFLMTFFKSGGGAKEVREINGFVLVKHFNGNTGLPEVQIMTPSAYHAYNYLEEKGLI